MKTFTAILTSATTLFCFSLFAQISIEPAHMIKAGLTLTQAQDFNAAAAITLGTVGSGKSWDFSSLKTDQTDTIKIVEASSLPKNELFPTANLGFKLSSNNDSIWSFIESNSQHVLILGSAGVDPSVGDTLPVYIEFELITLNSTLGTNYSHNSTFVVGTFEINVDPDGNGPHPNIDSIRFKTSRVSNSIMDAEGSLKTPLGTFNTLRQEIEEVTIDSILMDTNGVWSLISPVAATMLFQDPITFDTSFSYRWWTNQQVGIPLVEFVYDKKNNQIVDEVIWINALPSGVPNGINEITDINVKLYPNPINDLLNITLEQHNKSTVHLRLIDMNGKLVFTDQLTAPNNTVDLSNITAGSYLYEIIGDNTLIQSGKLMVK